MTLLEKAIKQKPKTHRLKIKLTKQHAQLLVAWLNGEITQMQAGHALGCKSYGSAISVLSPLLVRCVEEKLIEVKLK